MPHIRPAAGDPSAQALARGLGAFALVVSLMFMLFAGAFPFDFRIPPDGAIQAIRSHFDWRWNPYDPGYSDRRQNLLFFAPFGFALASLIRTRRRDPLAKIGVAILLAAPLSFLIETTQTLVSFRDPSFADVWCNTLGSAIGAMLYILCGRPILEAAARSLLHLRRLANPITLGIVTACYAVLHLCAPLLYRHPGDLGLWDRNMSMMVGNESTGDRAWTGHVSQIILTDRAAEPNEVLMLARNDSNPSEIFGPSLLSHYRLGGLNAPFADLAGHDNPLIWTNNALPAPSASENGPLVVPENWLQTPQPITDAIERIARTSQFTLAAVVSTADLYQRGPARVVSISSGIRQINVQIGQEFSDLNVRVRNALRSMPDLYLRDVFTDTKPRHIVVTQRQAQIAVYIDGQERGRVEITPEAKLIWRLYPRGSQRMRIERYGFRSYAAIYRMLVFIPFAALLSATLMLTTLRPAVRRIILIGAIVAFALAIEAILGSQSASGFQPRNLAISLIIALTTSGFIAAIKYGNKGT